MKNNSKSNDRFTDNQKKQQQTIHSNLLLIFVFVI